MALTRVDPTDFAARRNAIAALDAAAGAIDGHDALGEFVWRDLEAPQAFLLTTTAERFFPKFGFERIERTDVPASLQASIEFRSACPSSAIVMRKAL